MLQLMIYVYITYIRHIMLCAIRLTANCDIKSNSQKHSNKLPLWPSGQHIAVANKRILVRTLVLLFFFFFFFGTVPYGQIYSRTRNN